MVVVGVRGVGGWGVPVPLECLLLLSPTKGGDSEGLRLPPCLSVGVWLLQEEQHQLS